MGIKVGRKRVARLMRLNDLSCLSRKRFQITTDSRHHEPVAQNILDRQFDVTEPNTVWVSDITYLPTAEGWLYLCVVIDLFDRMVVGWSMRTDMTSAIVIDAFAMALLRRKPERHAHVPLRPRYPVLLLGFPRSLLGCPADACQKHEPQGELLGQRLL